MPPLSRSRLSSSCHSGGGRPTARCRAWVRWPWPPLCRDLLRGVNTQRTPPPPNPAPAAEAGCGICRVHGCFDNAFFGEAGTDFAHLRPRITRTSTAPRGFLAGTATDAAAGGRPAPRVLVYFCPSVRSAEGPPSKERARSAGQRDPAPAMCACIRCAATFSTRAPGGHRGTPSGRVTLIRRPVLLTAPPPGRSSAGAVRRARGEPDSRGRSSPVFALDFWPFRGPRSSRSRRNAAGASCLPLPLYGPRRCAEDVAGARGSTSDPGRTLLARPQLPH